MSSAPPRAPTTTGTRVLRAIPAALYAVGVFYGGIIDIGPLPQTPGLPADKVGHALAFLVFEWLLELALLEHPPRLRRPIAVAASAAVGFLLEAVQSALPHRSADWIDCIADVTGALAGGVILALASRALRARRERPRTELKREPTAQGAESR